MQLLNHLRIGMEEAVEMREHHLCSPILALPRIAGYVHSGYGCLAEHRLGNAWFVFPAVDHRRMPACHQCRFIYDATSGTVDDQRLGFARPEQVGIAEVISGVGTIEGEWGMKRDYVRHCGHCFDSRKPIAATCSMLMFGSERIAYYHIPTSAFGHLLH